MARDLEPHSLPAALCGEGVWPPLPEHARSLLERAREEGADLDSLVEVVTRDEGVAARLLAFANSTLCALGTSTSSLPRASLLLGMRSLQVLGMALLLVDEFESLQVEGVDHDLLWKRAVVRGVTGRLLAAHLGTMTEDECFLSGLADELGLLLFARHAGAPDHLPRYLSPELWADHAEERRELGFARTDLTEALFDAWSLPPFLQEAQRISHLPAHAQPTGCRETLRTARILALARRVTDLLTLEHDPEAGSRLVADGREFFGLHPNELTRVLAPLRSLAREASALLGLPVVDVDSLQDHVPSHVPDDGDQDQTPTAVRAVLADARWLRASTDRSLRTAVADLPGEAAFELALAAAAEHLASSEAPGSLGVLLLGSEDDPDVVARHVAPALRERDFVASLEDGSLAILPLPCSAEAICAIAERLEDRLAELGRDRGDASGARRGTASLGAALLERPWEPEEVQQLLLRTRIALVRAQSSERGPWRFSFDAPPPRAA